MSLNATKVAVTRRLPADIEERMGELFDTRFNQTDAALSRRELGELMAAHDVLVPTVADVIDGELINAAGAHLKLIANFGNGTDNIDVDAAHARGITVTNTPSVLTEDTADMVMALILAVPRRLVEGDRLIRKPGSFRAGRRHGCWDGVWRANVWALSAWGASARPWRGARVFGLEVFYHNRNRLHADVEAETGATFVESLDRMLRKVDIVSVNCPHTPATYHLLSARRLGLLPPQATLINTSRGEVIDEGALADALSAGRLGGAGLDVFEREPAVNPRLLELENVVLLPHMSSATMESRQSMGEKVIINIKTFADGHHPPDWVLPSDARF